MTRTDRAAYLGRAAALMVSIATILGLLVVAPSLWTRFVADGRVLTRAEAPARDVAIIFGAEMYPSGEPSPYLRARLDLGAALYADGRTKLLVVSGDNSAAHNFEATNMRHYLVAQGIPEEAIVEDGYGLDTYSTCVRAKQVFGVATALLVSQRYHLSRAVSTCQAVGLDAVGVGDVSVKRTSGRWDAFARREIGANVKMIVDLVLRRRPSLEGDPKAVAEALNR
ncbi:MAG: vancomycin high temperature exclusion protein [Propioniciclava sp.]